MKIKCEYCEQMIEDTDPQCPYCGAVNENVKRGASQVPTTIDELKSFCVAHNMPLEKMRFFIGEDYKGARAFGIFQDGNGDFVVYKNKDNGQRAVRYKGKDEAYAVNEIYQKLKAEVLDRRNVKVSPGQADPQNYPAMQKKDELRRRRDGKKKKKKSSVMSVVITIAVIMVIVALILIPDNSTRSGYYSYDGNTYYNQNGSWYMYDDSLDDWTSDFDVPDELDDDKSAGDYYQSISYSDDMGAADFQESDYYVETSSYDDDDWDSDSWDSDDSWSSDDSWDSWDSGSTDWDSDW